MLGKSATSAPWRYNAALKAPKCLSSVENGAPGDQARLGGKVGWPYVGLMSFFHLGRRCAVFGARCYAIFSARCYVVSGAKCYAILGAICYLVIDSVMRFLMLGVMRFFGLGVMCF